MNEKSKDQKKPGNNNKRRNRNRGNRNRKTELNIPDSALNAADLRNLHFQRKDEADNDLKWYNNAPDVINAVGRVPFALAEGDKYSFVETLNGADDLPWVRKHRANPGIMRFDIIPTYGTNKSATSSLNLAAMETFTILRNASSGTMKYDQNDVMLQIIAIDNALMLYQYLCRAYRAAFTVDYTNKYLPDFMLQAMKVSPKIRTQLADFEAAMTYFVTKLGMINIPDQFDIIHRHQWLYERVYKDSPSRKAQMYLFNPSHLYVYQETDADMGSKLVLTPMQTITGTKTSDMFINTADDVVAAIDYVLSPILGSSSFGQINGQMDKAFGNGAMIKVSALDRFGMLDIAYSSEVNSEIENATIVDDETFNYTNSLGAWNITQNMSDLSKGPYLESDTVLLTGQLYAKSHLGDVKRLLNMHIEDPGVLDIAAATRFTVGIEELGNSQVRLMVGTEVIKSAKYLYYSIGSTGAYNYSTLDMFSYSTYQNNANSTVNWYGNQLSALTLHSAFDWAPPVMSFTSEADAEFNVTKVTFAGYICDVDNYAIVEFSDLGKIHDACILSLLVNKDYGLNIKH